MLDLGAWATESYRVLVEEQHNEDDSQNPHLSD